MFLTLMSCLVIGAPVTISNTYDVLGRNEVSNAVFLSFARITWGLAISWIIFSCQCGLNKHLNRFLSWKFWIPIGRMGLSIYLIHPVLQLNFVIWQGEKVSLEIGQMVSCCRKVPTKCLLFILPLLLQLTNFLIELVITAPCAVIIFLTVEEPFSLIGKFITRNINNKSPARVVKWIVMLISQQISWIFFFIVVQWEIAVGE